jgi:hypothetical protein
VSLPKPLPGLVICYNYLWADDALDGREEGGKQRPAAIVMAVDQPRQDNPGTTETRVYVLPITHSAPAKGTAAIQIPAQVSRAAGLDAARSWIVLSEFNEFVWPGFDLARIPGRNTNAFVYGFLTPGFFASVRDRWLALDAAGKSQSVPRDE